MTTPSHDWKNRAKPAWPILFIVLIVGMVLSIFTQHAIGEKTPAICTIGDSLQEWTAPLHAYVSEHPMLASALMVFYSIVGDAIVLIMVVCAIVQSSVRPILPFIVFMIFRQTMQTLVAFPVDPGIIWHYPGFPSLFTNYQLGGDFYFSAYVGINILGALELGQIFRHRWITIINCLIAAMVVMIDIVLRSHYTTDIYTSVITAIFAYLFTQEFVPPIDRFLKKLDKISHFLLVTLICLGIAAIFTTQYFIAQKAIPDCGIDDLVQNFFLPFNEYLRSHVLVSNGVLILMNFLIDCMFVFMFIDTIITRNIRPFLTYVLFFALRQSLQLLVSLPAPLHTIWHDPGFPSLLQNYQIANDFYFSGHAGISLIAALEMASFGKRWFTLFGFSIFILESFLVIAMQIHYTMDVFTAIMTVFCITDLSIHLSHPINRWLARLMKSS